ncbi:MAG: DUF4384 domain-containing protein [candidate division Zixibacteria bacterium]|nr:DUF4384 domain-containing protein [candidate division Zixibacteria bacterium]
MLRRIIPTLIVAVLAVILMAPVASAQNIARQYDDDDYRYQQEDYTPRYDDPQVGDRGRVDRYLDAEVWTNHDDGEYYEGDNITIHFRVNRDAFIVIYTIDTRGRLNMLFPTDPTESNFVNGGVTYHLPAGWDDYDLVVTGPEGVETIQIIASREQIPIPDWYPQSGVVCDWEDRHEFLDYVNDRHFVRYEGQRFAYDRASIYVDEWEEHYFRPVYQPVYHHWTMCGNVYLDYPFGASVYVNGIYWGCTPLYLPRVYVGWHTFTIYDEWGYCWESDIHVSRYNTVVLDYNVVRPRPHVQSKFKQVRQVAYRNPAKNGYPKYVARKTAILNSKKVSRKNVVLADKSGNNVTKMVTVGSKRNIRGSGSMTKSERGWGTTGLIGSASSKAKRDKSTRRSAIGESSNDWRSKSGTRTKDYSSKSAGSSSSGKSRGSSVSRSSQSSGSSSKAKAAQRKTVTRSKESSSGYYQKKSSGSPSKSKSSKGKSGSVKKSKSSGGSSSSGSSVKNSGSKSSGTSTKSTGTKSKSSGSKSKGKGGRK